MKNNDIKTGWLDFLYVWFTIQYFIIPILAILTIIGIIQYSKGYSSAESLGMPIILLLLYIAREIAKIYTCNNKYTENGYKSFMITFILDAISVVINGFSREIIIGVITVAIAAPIFILSIIYVKKRKGLFEETTLCEDEKSYECGEYGNTSPIHIEEKKEDLQTIRQEILPDIEESQQIKKQDETNSSKMPILFCRKCGAMISSDSIFCNKCGTKITEVK